MLVFCQCRATSAQDSAPSTYQSRSLSTALNCGPPILMSHGLMTEEGTTTVQPKGKMMKSLPVPRSIVGESLELRPLQATDFESLYNVASDPLVWAQHPSPMRYQAPVFREWFDQALASQCALVVLDRSNNRVTARVQRSESQYVASVHPGLPAPSTTLWSSNRKCTVGSLPKFRLDGNQILNFCARVGVGIVVEFRP